MTKKKPTPEKPTPEPKVIHIFKPPPLDASAAERREFARKVREAVLGSQSPPADPPPDSA